MNKQHAAQKIREHLERRLSQLIDCDESELPRLKIGTLLHLLYTLGGDLPSFGGFPTAIHGVLQILGYELVWDVAEEPKAEPTSQAVIN